MPLAAPAVAGVDPASWALVSDAFSGTLAGYTATNAQIVSGALKAVAADTAGSLVPRNLAVRNSVHQLKFTRSGAGTAATTSVGFYVSRADASNLIVGQWEYGAVTAQLSLYAFEPGFGILAQTLGLTRIADGASQWLRLAVHGDTLLLNLYTSDPEAIPAPAPFATVTAAVSTGVRTTNYGLSAKPLPFGLTLNLPAAWSVDDYKVWKS
ncbi:MAG: hypothetical protein V4636_00330 [Pseudomonadota bacterium]